MPVIGCPRGAHLGCRFALLLSVAASACGGDENKEGTIEFDLNLSTTLNREFQIREQSMCDGSARATVDYDKADNLLVLTVDFEGLPRRPRYCYEYDPTTPWNRYPPCVEDGRWQLWLLGGIFATTTTFYYDGTTGDLLGHENDLDGPPPADAMAVEIPTTQELCTDFFEPDPGSTRTSARFEFQYDRILDRVGSAGAYASFVPRNINDQDVVEVYYTKSLPADEAMNFDDILEQIDNQGGFAVSSSYEPFPKPDYLRSIDNLMKAWGAVYPSTAYTFREPPAGCSSFQWPDPFPPYD